MLQQFIQFSSTHFVSSYFTINLLSVGAALSVIVVYYEKSMID